MQLVRLLLLLHLGLTAALLVLLSVVVVAQRTRAAVRSRPGRVAAPARPQDEPAAAGGASVLDWSVDLRGVGQREAALRT